MTWQDWCIGCLICVSKIFIKTCGIGLMIFFYALFAAVCYSFRYDVADLYLISQSYFSLTVNDIVVILIFQIATVLFIVSGLNSLFNYTMASWTSPGTTKDAEYRELLTNFADQEVGKCRHCNLPKPNNVHHCSACNACVINLDHHCPWVNNCVGFKNMRYFLLFLLYTWVACLVYTCMALPIMFEGNYSLVTLPVRFLTVTILAATLSVLLLCFWLWSWYLALSDQQLIDILKRRRGVGTQGERNIIWTTEYIEMRCYYVFGTKSFLRAFYPSTRKININPFEPPSETNNLLASYT